MARRRGLERGAGPPTVHGAANLTHLGRARRAARRAGRPARRGAPRPLLHYSRAPLMLPCPAAQGFKQRYLNTGVCRTCLLVFAECSTSVFQSYLLCNVINVNNPELNWGTSITKLAGVRFFTPVHQNYWITIKTRRNFYFCIRFVGISSISLTSLPVVTSQVRKKITC